MSSPSFPSLSPSDPARSLSFELPSDIDAFLSLFTDNHGKSLWISLDIDGTLTKVLSIIPRSVCAEFSALEDPSTPPIPLNALLNALAETRGFPLNRGASEELVVKTYLFCSREIGPLVAHLKSVIRKSATLGHGMPRIRATGGGALKYSSLLHEELDVEIEKIPEMDSLVAGLNFCVSNLENSVFRFDLQTRTCTAPTASTDPSSTPSWPLLLVNIGSGVSMLRVDGPSSFKRVSGTPLGGGTALGLGKLLIPGCTDFEKLIELSRKGDAARVDLSVGELIGRWGDVNEGLAADTLAASLGKLEKRGRDEDVAQSILRMVSYNIGYVAYLVAKLQNINKVFFSGKFVHKHEPTMEAIAYAVEFYGKSWGGSKLEARFLTHEGFLGAIGALLTS